MVVTAIVAAEVMFWVLLLGGLGTRYLLRLRRLSTILLLLVPALDLALLAIVAGHLWSGSTAESSHGIAALYLGFTVAYGHSAIRWMDARFAHRFAGGPPPTKPPRRGMTRVRHEIKIWLQGLVACLIGAGTLAVLSVTVGDSSRTAALNAYYQPLAIFMVVNTAISAWDAVSALVVGQHTKPNDGEALPHGETPAASASSRMRAR